MNRPPKANFQLILKEKDWIDKYRCWSCQLLGVPSVEVIKVTGDAGQEFSPSTYKLYGSHLYWTGNINFHPGEITLSIQMSTQELVFKSGQDKWKLSTGILSVITSLLTLVIIPLGLEYIKRQSWFPPTPTPLVSPLPKVATSTTPQISIPKSPKNPYYDFKYPTAGDESCGKLYTPKKNNSPKVTIYYPVFIPEKHSLSEAVKFCHDAYIKPGNSDIQIASFTDESQADMFIEFIRKHFPEARRGKQERG